MRQGFFVKNYQSNSAKHILNENEKRYPALLTHICTKVTPFKKTVHTIDCITCQHKATSAFCNLRMNELESLNQHKTTFQVKKKHILFHEGDMVKGLHCVHDGIVKLYKTLNDGSTQIVRLAKSADLIGYRGLLGNGRYIATAETMEDSIICFIPKEKILEFITHNVNFTLDIMSKIAADTSDAETRALNLLQKSSKERLAETLLLLEQSFGKTEEGFINIHLTREEIAGITGIAVETTVRTLHQWDEEGLIKLVKKQIRILNKNKLLELSSTED